jgi:signal transduction histidine kinase
MNLKESFVYIALLLLANIVIFLMFAFAYLEKITEETLLLQDKRNAFVVLSERYNMVQMISETQYNKTILSLGGVGFVNKVELYKRVDRNVYISVDYSGIISNVITNKYFIIANLVVLINSMFLYYNIIYKRRIELKQKNFIESRLQFQTTMILTENLHHEINTPLAVISHKVKKMAIKLKEKSLTVYGCSFAEVEVDYKAIDASITMIRDILERLKSAKHLKLYESNRTYYEVIQSSCEMMKISNSDHFDYVIDEQLKNYKVDGRHMKNGELSGILLNHIKNSVEADTTTIIFKLGDVKDNLCTIYIGDNGNGIPNEMKTEIFNENHSSKEGIRGNGLYINRFLVQNAKGSIRLVGTSSNGTAFELKLMSLLSTEEDIKRTEEANFDVVKRLEEDIANRDTLIQQFLDSLPDMAWLKDIDGKYIIANKAIKEGLLFDNEPIGKTDIEMALKAKETFGSDNHTFGEKCANSDVITVENNQPSRFLESGKIKGEMLYLEVYKNVIRDLNGNVIGICGSGRDLTEYMEAVKQFEQTCGFCPKDFHILDVFKKYNFEGQIT